jgi:DNA polymerase-1
MNSNYEIVGNPDQLRQTCERLSHAEAIGLDTETTDLNPHDGRLRLIQLSTPDYPTQIIDLNRIPPFPDHFKPLKQLLEEPRPRTVCHNGKFDAKWLKHSLDIDLTGIFDSQLAAQIIDYPGKHSLRAVAGKYLNIELDKTQQLSDWNAPELSEEQYAYAARDAQALVPLRQAMIPRLLQDGLVATAQLEFEAITAFGDIELNGIFLDAGRWQEQIEIVDRKHEILSHELQQMLAVGAIQGTLFERSDINLGSHPQMAAALRRVGVPIEKATRNNILLPLSNTYPIVAKLLEYRSVDKEHTSYGRNWLASIHPRTLRIHPDFQQLGAPTGRASCTDPNVQQVPHGIEYRRCFRAPAGRKFAIVDYSQIELRILAHKCLDEGFLKAFRSGADLHRTTAAQVFNVAIDQVTSQQRDFAKRLNFGVVYGIGAKRFSNMTGMPVPEAEATLKRYFETYRRLDDHLKEAGQRAVENRYSRTLAGRMIKYRYDPSDRQAISNVRRQGRNGPIQGTGADILKRSLFLVSQELKGTTAQIVNVIHDEIVVECDADQAEEIGQRVSTKMVQAATEYITAVPILAEPTIADEWVK